MDGWAEEFSRPSREWMPLWAYSQKITLKDVAEAHHFQHFPPSWLMAKG
jgi:hypothetical protein